MATDLFPPLDRTDVSYEKIKELHDRLLAATKAGTVTWERGRADFTFETPHGIVDVEPKGVTIWNDSGRRLRQFHPGTNGLYEAALAQHQANAVVVIERIITELDAREARDGAASERVDPQDEASYGSAARVCDCGG